MSGVSVIQKLRRAWFWKGAAPGLWWLSSSLPVWTAEDPSGSGSQTQDLPPPSLPDFGAEALRVLGALILVVTVFFLGVWIFKNWQRLAVRRGQAPKLNVLETRYLGNRYALYVVGYEQERLLIGASPAGLALLTRLPQAADQQAPGAVSHSFEEALREVVRGP